MSRRARLLRRMVREADRKRRPRPRWTFASFTLLEVKTEARMLSADDLDEIRRSARGRYSVAL